MTAASAPWSAYEPSRDAPWNLRRVVHLHRRAGFAATWGEIQRDLKDGPKASIDRVLAGKAATEGVPERFAETADLLGDAAASSRDPARLKAWWVYRMLFGPDPLGVRLAGQHPVDAGLRPVLDVALDFAPGGGEAGPAVQLNDPAQAPRGAVVRLVGRPRARGVGDTAEGS